ncbi:MAG: hypothetical protein A2756_00945 [Candidatus Ryanbacteria bacterium RIFCSPHIGHO2_01_FULL_48_27]|uniref:SGNH hydrolase-type esterase domain-containing protein n=1 Tax=Candidatus Ryanbacteria bacterium RIFCSPHIGHO2_01_FULL_48_27 TaxID=1802115 RepID=A0A1G2G5M4_9BACT|nr:MAG: hypothetical protein A2756_00945 [Candidatus Ryanbacteria bacterium RIFCSPHIGHO2_01_FULL_48_27]
MLGPGNRRVGGFLLAVAVVGASLWRLFLYVSSFVDAPHGGTNIIVFGDSLTEGIGASPGHDFVSLLSRSLGIPIINAGRSGDTTASALGRLERDVLSRDPKVVVVELAGNDSLQRYPIDETFKNLRTIIGRIHAVGGGVVLVGIRGGLLSDRYKSEYRKLVRDTKVSFVPDILGGILGDPKLMYDGIHPNDAGYVIVASRIEPVLGAVLEAE